MPKEEPQKEQDIDDIIKQHLEEEGSPVRRRAIRTKPKDAEEPSDKKDSAAGTSPASPEDDDDEDGGYDYMDDSLNLTVRSPKTTLIEHLRLLSDIFNSSLDEASEYYDQIFDERVQFMLDFENILKIMTFDETVEFVLPCMQIYSSE